MVRRILRRHCYPPDKEEKATRTVLEQAEQLGLGLIQEPVPVAGDVRVVPFQVLEAARARPGANCVPLYTLQAAAASAPFKSPRPKPSSSPTVGGGALPSSSWRKSTASR